MEPIDLEKINSLRNKIKDVLDLNDSYIPEDIKIATMTLEGKFNTAFYPLNIFKYMKRTPDGIIGVNKGKEKKKTNEEDEDEEDYLSEIQKVISDSKSSISLQSKVIRNDKTYNKTYNETYNNTIATQKPNQKKGQQSKNRQSDEFLNQVTVLIGVSNKIKPVSVKIFSNGAIHFTGCVNIDNMLEATYKLARECKREIAVLTKKSKIREIKFVDDPDVLKLENLDSIKVDMINCIFTVPFKIDRPKLQVLMKSDGYNSSYDSNGHAGVKIKETSTGKKVTIFVFESGSIIIILGKQGFKRINNIYTNVYKYLLENYESIVKDDDITASVILRYIDQSDKQPDKQSDRQPNDTANSMIDNSHLKISPKINTDFNISLKKHDPQVKINMDGKPLI